MGTDKYLTFIESLRLSPLSNMSDPKEGQEITDIQLPEGLSADLLNNPTLVAAVQAKLNGLVGTTTNLMDHLPQCVKNRINALKNLQLECAKLEGKFYEEAHELEMKYAELFKPLYEKRCNVVNGKHEPTEEECKWVEPGEEDDEDEEEEEATAE